MKPVLWLVFMLTVTTFSRAENARANLNIVPRPASVRYSTGVFILTNRTRILATAADSRRIAGLFNEFLLNQHGMRLKSATGTSTGDNIISLSQQRNRELPAEGYRLSIGPKSIRVTGRGAGLFYGMQTLTQLLPLGPHSSIELPSLEITDYPRFAYRGVLLDVGRHFFSVTYLKQYIDLLAQYKINTFHWHLTDDQGWRIEMPGHSQAAIAAYPELACSFTQPGADGASELLGHIFCPKPETFTFLENVLSEVISLFPGPYIHIGGDEVPRDEWRQSTEAQAIIKREGLKSEDELQSFFVKHIEKFLNSKGRRMIGWDEILEGGLAPNAIVMSWRGLSGGIQAAQQKHDVIMSPTDFCYLDYNQGDLQREPPSIGGYLPLAKVYSYDPVPKELTPEEQKYILGVQGNVWGEYISTPEHLEYMTFPRLFALAEVGWSPLEGKNYDDFRRRLPYQLSRLERQGVNYRVPEPDGLNDFYTASQDHATVELRPVTPGSRIYYTLDGSLPNDHSRRYQSPFEIPMAENEKTVLDLVVVTPGGRRSIAYGATFLRRPYVDAVSNNVSQPGLTYTVFDGNFRSARNLEEGVRTTSGTTSSLDLQQFGHEQKYGLEFDGYVRVPSDGFYEFAVESDDGAILQIDDEVVVDNDGSHGPRSASGHIPLRQGFHKLQLRYFQAEGGAWLRVLWGVMGTELKPIDGSAVYH